MNEEEKLVKEQWNKLPPELQKAIDALPWKPLVQEIGKANALDAEQLASLEQETMFVLYAFENPKDYVPNLVANIGVSEDVAYTIAESVAEKVFEPISQKAVISDNNLPMVEEGERAHDVPHAESAPAPIPPPAPKPPETQPQPKVQTPLPDYRYPDGADPYREPLK